MPELPEVEVVRLGLERWVTGRTVANVHVQHPRAVRRHILGAEDFRSLLVGRTVTAARRRGKYLWLPLDSGDALLAHLGMSGQMLLRPPGSPDEKHLRVRFTFDDGGTELRFVDQRTFGGLVLVPDGAELPAPIAHIAPDPFEAAFDPEALTAAMRRRRTGVKRALLDQTLVSGVGNIYADEALWHARLHYARPTETLTRREIGRLLDGLRSVLADALGRGGTSFDSLYVDVDGERGYFGLSLSVYGREGEPCLRCATLIRREAFMNRSSFFCPRCQPRPRRARW